VALHADDGQVEWHAQSDVHWEGYGESHWEVEARVGIGDSHFHGSRDGDVGCAGCKDGEQETVSGICGDKAGEPGGGSTEDEGGKKGECDGLYTVGNESFDFSA
jgi:hypothetical protein